MTIDLTSIANAVIALIAAIITAFVIPWIRSKTTAAQFEKIKMCGGRLASDPRDHEARRPPHSLRKSKCG